jgi:hypothetical protein
VFSSQNVYNSHQSAAQDCTYLTNGPQAIQCGEQVGPFSVAGYVGTQGGRLI